MGGALFLSATQGTISIDSSVFLKSISSEHESAFIQSVFPLLNLSNSEFSIQQSLLVKSQSAGASTWLFAPIRTQDYNLLVDSTVFSNL
jgi:hypothetical protein